MGGEGGGVDQNNPQSPKSFGGEVNLYGDAMGRYIPKHKYIMSLKSIPSFVSRKNMNVFSKDLYLKGLLNDPLNWGGGGGGT